jgi:hypothetical protein
LTPLRRAISLACAVALMAGGAVILFREMSGLAHLSGKAAAIPIFMIGVGAVWFFSDLPRGDK